MNFRKLKAIFVLAFTLFLPIAALAQETPASGSGSGAAPAATPAEPRRTPPQAGPFQVDSVSAGLGGTESGPVVHGSVAVSTEGQQEQVILEMYNGMPVLRLEIDGRSHRLDVNILRHEFTSGSADDPASHEISIELRTLQAESDVTIPVGGDFRARLVITPEVAAAYSLGVDRLTGTAEIFIGAAGGVTADEDGAAGVLGIRIGGRLRAEYEIDDRNRVHGSFGIDQLFNVLPGLNASPSIVGSVGWQHLVRDSDGRVSHSFGLDFVGKTDAYDVERPTNGDDGRNTFIGLTGTYSFSGL